MIHAIGHHIDFKGKSVISQMCKFLSAGNLLLEEIAPNIIDLASYGVPDSDVIQPNDIVLVYGEKSAREIGECPAKIKVEFCELASLDAAFGNEEARQEAWKQLKKIKQLLEKKEETISERYEAECLPVSLDSATIFKMLEKALRDKEEWVGITHSGKSICLSLERKKKKTADICLTFTELYMMKLAMETLDIKEFSIVYSQGNPQ